MMRKLAATLTIIAGLCAASAAMGQADQPALASPADAQLETTLLANAWCGSLPDADSGKAIQAHAQFSTNGSLEVTRTSEGAQVGSQTMGWKVEGGQLLLGGGDNWQAYPVQVGKTADGTVTLTGDGPAWNAC